MRSIQSLIPEQPQALLLVRQTLYPKPFAPHYHRDLTIVRILQGSRSCLINRHAFHASAGDLLFFEPYDIHSCQDDSDEPLSYVSLKIDASLLQDCEYRSSRKCLGSGRLAGAFEQLISDLQQGGDRQDACRLLKAFFEQCEPDPSSMPSARLFLQSLEKASDLPRNCQDLCKAFSLSRASLHRLFSKETAMTPGHVLSNIRLNQAQSALDAASRLCALAAEYGFCDQSDFSRQFSAMHGYPPGLLKASLRKNSQISDEKKMHSSD